MERAELAMRFYGSVMEKRNIRKPIAAIIAVYSSLSPAYFERSPAALITMNARKNIG